MRYKLFYISKDFLAIASAPRFYYTDYTTQQSNYQTIFKLDRPIDQDKAIEYYKVLDYYDDTYIVRFKKVDYRKFLLVGERSTLFNYNIIDEVSDLRAEVVPPQFRKGLIQIDREIGKQIMTSLLN